MLVKRSFPNQSTGSTYSETGKYPSQNLRAVDYKHNTMLAGLEHLAKVVWRKLGAVDLGPLLNALISSQVPLLELVASESSGTSAVEVKLSLVRHGCHTKVTTPKFWAAVSSPGTDNMNA